MKFRAVITCVGVFAFSSLLGGVLGERINPLDDKEKDAIREFTEILSVAEASYPADVDSRQMIQDAIRGMLLDLDPHSNYLDPKTYRAMRDEQKGSFSGLGIVVTKKGDLLTVISPIEGTPAYRMGIRAGDIISHIEGEPTESLTLDEAVSRLKGKKGTKVNIAIKRLGVEKPIPITIVRDDIPTKSLTKSFMLEPGTGYVKIKNFTRTTSDELEKALQELTGQGMQRLILDLRINPGGLLEQAVKVTGMFLKPGQVVVETRGRTGDANNVYRDERGSVHFDKPLIVLVNRASASASEILAGAVQDHDRGLIIGETTWGKGLVQSVFPLRYDAGIALTTARYYTPSGRCIQRDYSSWEDYYNPEQLDMEEPAPAEGENAVRTDTGRPVYGSGGITPDVVLKPKPLSSIVEKLFAKDLFFKYAVQFTATHPDLKRGFVLNKDDLEEFRRLAEAEGIDTKAEGFEDDLDEIARRVRWQVSSAKLWHEESYRIEAEMDTVLQEAKQYFPQAEELMTRAALVASRQHAAADQAGTIPGKDADKAKDNPIP